MQAGHVHCGMHLEAPLKPMASSHNSHTSSHCSSHSIFLKGPLPSSQLQAALFRASPGVPAYMPTTLNP